MKRHSAPPGAPPAPLDALPGAQPDAQPRRPRVVLHVGQSIDGKLAAPDQGATAMGGPADVRQMARLRCWADALLVGAETVRKANVPCTLRDERLQQRRLAAGRPAHPQVVVLTASGRLPADARALQLPPGGLPPIVAVGAAADEASLRALPPHVLRWRLAPAHAFAPVGAEQGINAPAASSAHEVAVTTLLTALYAHGVRRLLVEGGGTTAWSFVAAGLLDDVVCSIAPCIVGGSKNPTPVDGTGLAFANRLQFKLQSARRQKDLVYLHYRRR